MHTNHPDYDWGVWGHNLAKLVKDEATDDMYAIVDVKLGVAAAVLAVAVVGFGAAIVIKKKKGGQ